MKKLIAILAVAGAMVTVQAGAHPGHAPAIISIDRPAAGTLYTNDVAQPGSISQLGAPGASDRTARTPS